MSLVFSHSWSDPRICSYVVICGLIALWCLLSPPESQSQSVHLREIQPPEIQPAQPPEIQPAIQPAQPPEIQPAIQTAQPPVIQPARQEHRSKPARPPELWSKPAHPPETLLSARQPGRPPKFSPFI
ncbi:cell division protein ZipA-like [Melanotaenia boesemani]|uniref:cell division protein ZipA-like n=1 Tax=Melanotaenia boesemani TaxID=1250792 RepID=UPI001C058E31|nr:cell division protein ZipA-like [Melanotaenia boesemani]